MIDSSGVRKGRAERLARRVAALRELGLTPARPAPVVDTCERLDPDTVQLSRAVPAMGTLVSVTALDSSRSRIDEAVGRALEAMHRAVDVFNRYDGSTPLFVLNDEGRLADPPAELRRVVSAALDLHRHSDGAFDPTVAPLVDLFAAGAPQRERGASRVSAPGSAARSTAPNSGHAPESVSAELPPSWTPPAAADVRRTAELVGADRVELDARAIRLRRTGMSLTLDGIAKGRIVDLMADVLREHGVRRFLINAGGDVLAAGPGPRGDGWTVGVRDPGQRDRLIDRVELLDAAVATSGSYEIHFDPERSYHHLVAAAAGRSPTGQTAVSVVAPTAMAADALATAAFVMPPPRAGAFLEARGAAGLLIDADGWSVRTRRWKAGVVADSGGDSARRGVDRPSHQPSRRTP